MLEGDVYCRAKSCVKMCEGVAPLCSQIASYNFLGDSCFCPPKAIVGISSLVMQQLDLESFLSVLK